MGFDQNESAVALVGMVGFRLLAAAVAGVELHQLVETTADGAGCPVHREVPHNEDPEHDEDSAFPYEGCVTAATFLAHCTVIVPWILVEGRWERFPWRPSPDWREV